MIGIITLCVARVQRRHRVRLRLEWFSLIRHSCVHFKHTFKCLMFTRFLDEHQSAENDSYVKVYYRLIHIPQNWAPGINVCELV